MTPAAQKAGSKVLSSLRARLAGWLAVRVVLLSLGVTAAAALGLVLLDAALDLPDQARAVALWVLGVCTAAVLGAGAWRWRRLDEQRVALLFERVQPSLGNRLINAVQFSWTTGRTPAEEFLRRESVALGRSAAAGLSVWLAVRAKVKFAALVVALPALAWLCCALLGGDLLRAVLPRFLDPHGDHPPYSKLQIEVAPGHARVLYGGQVEIRATTRGRPADKLWLAANSGTNAVRTLMFLAPDKSFFQTLANLREPTEYFVTDGQARSRRFPIVIRYTPQITMVEVTTVFPDYTGKPARTGKLSDEPQALPEDTRVTFRVASNRPLKAGSLTLTPVLGGKPAQIPFQPEAQNTVVSGGFVLSEAVVFTLSVRDVDGLDCAQPRQGRFNLLPDERPRIFVLEPGRDAVATPSIRVPVRVQAQDDYGITRVVWLRGHNRSIERPLNMKLELKGGPQSVEAAGAFDFQKLGVRPGDVIEYYFEAADNYPKGPNLALSRLYRVEIISQEQYQEILRREAARKALFEPYFQLDRWLQRLAERARDLQKKAEIGSEAGKQAAAREAAELEAELAKYERELGDLLQKAILFDVEQSFRNTLVEQHTGVGQARQKLKEGLGNGQLDPKRLAEASDALSELARTEDSDVDQPAQQIAAVAHLLAQADTFVKLAHEQATLAQMARRFEDRAGGLSRVEQIEMQELAHQQQRIEESLKALLETLPELMAKVPDDPQYAPLRDEVNGFIQAVAEAKIDPDMSGSFQALTGQDGKTGTPLAQRAADKMDKLISKCNGLGQQAGKCLHFQPKVQQAMGRTLEQILAAMGAGNGRGGQDGYTMFNDDVALYGPQSERSGEQAGGRSDRGTRPSRGAETLAGDTRDPGLKPAEAAGRVHLQPDARFPLRYRELVGEYFKAIAESETDGEKR